MLSNSVGLILLLATNLVSTKPSNGYPSYNYGSYNPYYTTYSWSNTPTPTYNPYSYQTYYPSPYASQTGQPSYTYDSAYPSYPSYPSYPTYPSYPQYSHYPSYPYYPYYSTQAPSVEPERLPPAGPAVWPTGKPKTTPRTAVWPTGSPTRPPSIPKWPTEKASRTTTTKPSWPTVKADISRPPKFLGWPTEKSASPATTSITEMPAVISSWPTGPPTTTVTKKPEKVPNWPTGPPTTAITEKTEKMPSWPTGPPRTTGIIPITQKWPTGHPIVQTTTIPIIITEVTAKTSAAQPTRTPMLSQSPRILEVTSIGPQVPDSRKDSTKRPKGGRGKDRGGRPRRPNSRRKQKSKGRIPKTKPPRIPTISPITTILPFIPDVDVETVEDIPKYILSGTVPGPTINSTDLQPRILPEGKDDPSVTKSFNETSLAPDGTDRTQIINTTESTIVSTTYASTHCKKLCLDARGKRFCCEYEMGRCPPKPASCYIPLSDPISRHKSKGQCVVDTQCAENFKCCLDYCEEEYYCTRVQFVL